MKIVVTPLLARIVVFFLSVACVVSLYGENRATLVDGINRPLRESRFTPLFPRALSQVGAVELSALNSSVYDYVPTQEEANAASAESPRLQSVLLNNDIFALYGKPGARTMGILGQYSLKEIEPIMNDFVARYDAANGIRGIIPSFYIIFGTVWPEGEIGILSDSVVRSYIEFAQERGWYVYLDHQIGKYTVETAMKKLLPYLQYPNVHLALDPEWRTTKPMKEIGYVTAEEINKAQSMMQEYMKDHGLPGRRMLVVHQFKPKMIANRPDVRSDFELVQLVHCADGFGAPALKKYAYAFNAEAKNIPIKSFKLFLEPKVEGAGYDNPIMSPEDVFLLEPRPYVIMYQ
ncbi:MAG TPA: hypothetical protein VJ861_07095 [Treponemataceae bacterium]|nr:hypothetical protein [Treponemataceae bacterium]